MRQDQRFSLECVFSRNWSLFVVFAAGTRTAKTVFFARSGKQSNSVWTMLGSVPYILMIGHVLTVAVIGLVWKLVGGITGGHFACACVNMGCWSAIEAFSVNCLRSVPAFAGCFLELNDVYWVLRSSNVFFKVSWYFYDESEFIVASLSPLRGQSFLS